MRSKNFKIIHLFNIVSIFSLVYITPMIVNFFQVGPLLVGNKYQSEIAYINNINDLIFHLYNNFSYYLNFFINPIFWFFISAFITQKAIKWVNS
ncbi:hypothetical protein CU321_07150 [Prochlorococcus marinus str. MU1412]|nr:hypothetical protein [Prochlorococcus marinus str. MU1412]